MVVSDPRAGMKTYLDTYYTASNVTIDDAVTLAQVLVQYGTPLEQVKENFINQSFDVVISLEEPVVTPLMDSDQTPYGYEFDVPVRIYTIDKRAGDDSLIVTGTILKFTVEAELRRILEDQPAGSQYRMGRGRVVNQYLGGDMIYGSEYIINYRRSTTA